MRCLTRLQVAILGYRQLAQQLAVPSVPFWPIARLSITVHAAPAAMRTSSSKQLRVPSVPSVPSCWVTHKYTPTSSCTFPVNNDNNYKTKHNNFFPPCGILPELYERYATGYRWISNINSYIYFNKELFGVIHRQITNMSSFIDKK